MNRLKLFLLSAAIGAAFTTTALNAQSSSLAKSQEMQEKRMQQKQKAEARKNMDPAVRAEKMVERYNEHLNLSDQQKAELTAILTQTGTKLSEIRNSDLEPKQKQVKAQAAVMLQEEKIAALLDEEQYSVFSEKKSAGEAKRKEKMEQMKARMQNAKRQGSRKGEMFGPDKTEK